MCYEVEGSVQGRGSAVCFAFDVLSTALLF